MTSRDQGAEATSAGCIWGCVLHPGAGSLPCSGTRQGPHLGSRKMQPQPGLCPCPGLTQSSLGAALVHIPREADTKAGVGWGGPQQCWELQRAQEQGTKSGEEAKEPSRRG